MGLEFDYVGRDVYSVDGKKLGTIKNVGNDVYQTSDYLVIDRPMARDVVIPTRAIEQSGNRLVVPFTEDFIDDAPKVDFDNGLRLEDQRALDSYYVRRAA